MIRIRVAGYFVIALTLLQGCFILSNDCEDPSPVNRELPDWIPYVEGSSLYFQSASGKDTLLVVAYSRGWYDSPNKCTPPVESINAIITSSGAFSDSINFHGSTDYMTFLVMWASEKINVQYYVRKKYVYWKLCECF